MFAKHWSYKYLGLPWVAYATGPDAYDCWGLVHHCLKEQFSVDVDRFLNVNVDDKQGIDDAANSQIDAGGWTQIAEPKEGAVVLMSTRSVIHHIGLYTSSGVLHSRKGPGVSIESIDTFKLAGFKRIEYWVHDSIIKNS